MILAIACIAVVCLGAWWAVKLLRAAHADYLQRESANAAAWKDLAINLSTAQTDATNRLLIRSGVAPAPKTNETRTPPSEIDHPVSDDEWAAQDEADEIEARAREALANPLQAELLEDAAKYDPMWAAVKERYDALKGKVH
jgi:hypothetical protein